MYDWSHIGDRASVARCLGKGMDTEAKVRVVRSIRKDLRMILYQRPGVRASVLLTPFNIN